MTIAIVEHQLTAFRGDDARVADHLRIPTTLRSRETDLNITARPMQSVEGFRIAHSIRFSSRANRIPHYISLTLAHDPGSPKSEFETVLEVDTGLPLSSPIDAVGRLDMPNHVFGI